MPAALTDFDADADALAFDALRARAMATLQRLAGSSWTDHNSHDPGITLLESLCYALSDLGYRIGHPVPDLVADVPVAPGAVAGGLLGPRVLLPSAPVTDDDLCRLLIGLPGVRNAWIVRADTPLAVHDAAQNLLLPPQVAGEPDATALASPNRHGLAPRGLRRVLLEKSGLDGDVDTASLLAAAHALLQRHRALGEDLAELRVLARLPVALEALVALAPGADAAATLAALHQALAEAIAPRPPLVGLRSLLARGLALERILEGPLSPAGVVDPDAWSRRSRPEALRVSDLIAVAMAVPGVQAVQHLAFLRDGRPTTDWALPIPPDRSAAYDLAGSRLQLARNGLRIDHPALRLQARRLAESRLRAAGPGDAASEAEAGDDPLAPPAGRPRALARYLSVLHHLPQAYGVGPAGLAEREGPERLALARQLKAYLSLFDQLLANQFAQLGRAGRLLAFARRDAADADPADDGTPAAQPVPDPGGALQLGQVWRAPPEADGADLATWLARVSADPWSAGPEATPDDALLAAHARLARAHALADHLLARVGEQWDDLRPAAPDDDAEADARATLADDAAALALRAQALADKRAWLAALPTQALRRGLGDDLLAGPALADGDALPTLPSAGAGLSARLACLLGQRDAAPLRLVEHILLRPLPADASQQAPLLLAPASADPYSLQLSVVLDADDPRWADADRRARLGASLAQEAPAHLQLRPLWLGTAALAAFDAAWARWRSLWQQALAGGGGALAATGEAGAPALAPLRSARNRLIDLLGLGDTVPLTDLRVADGSVAAGGLKVGHGTRARISIDDAEAGVLYSLVAEDGGPLKDAQGVPLPPVQALGADARLVLETPPVVEDCRYRVQARKQPVGGRPAQAPVLLAQAALVKVGLDTSLALSLPDLPLLDARLANPGPGDARLAPHGQPLRVLVHGTQEGVQYSLVVDGRLQPGGAMGNLDIVTLTSPPMAEDCTLAVQASKRFIGRDGEAVDTAMLDQRLAVAVRADRTPALARQPAALIDWQAPDAALQLDRSQASASYQLWARPVADAEWRRGTDLPPDALQARAQSPAVAMPVLGDDGLPAEGFQRVGSPVAGTGGALALPWPAARADSVLRVTALKQHAGRDGLAVGTETTLAAAALVLVRPDPAPALQATLQLGATGQPLQLRLAGGQPGVAYAVLPPAPDGERPEPDAEAVGSVVSGYVHQRDATDAGQNKGLGQLMLGVDWIVAATPDPDQPPAQPELPDRAGLPAAPAQRPPADPLLPVPAKAAGEPLRLAGRKVHTDAVVLLHRPVAWDAGPSARLDAPWQAPGAKLALQIDASRAGSRHRLWWQGRLVAEAGSDGSPIMLHTEALPAGSPRSAPPDGWLVLQSLPPADAEADAQALRAATEQRLWLQWLPHGEIAVQAERLALVTGEAARVLLAESQPGVLYRLVDPAAPDAALSDTLPGNGAPLRLSTAPLAQDQSLQVQALREGEPTARVALGPVLAVTVTAPPPPPPPPPPPEPPPLVVPASPALPGLLVPGLLQPGAPAVLQPGLPAELQPPALRTETPGATPGTAAPGAPDASPPADAPTPPPDADGNPS